MPYIPNEDRTGFEYIIQTLTAALTTDEPFAGRLNYVISSVLANMIKEKGMSYGLINEFIGALECAKLEAYRRVAAPYEDMKVSENGDVYFNCAYEEGDGE
tara:strand:- start:40 stop:342 length:303 start_codon:yes stop_codon:yes gene_type:complete